MAAQPTVNSPQPAADNGTNRNPLRLRRGVHSIFVTVRQWATEHKGEILWAAIFAVVVAWFLDPPRPHPYTIYVVADSRTEAETMGIFQNMERSSSAEALNIGEVPVEVHVEKLKDATAAAAIEKALELTSRKDTLLVVAHLPSQLVEESMPYYLQASPPVPVFTTTASDEDLLIKCRAVGLKCFRDGWFAPMLQLSPTNKEQGRAAIRFATQHGRRRFFDHL